MTTRKTQFPPKSILVPLDETPASEPAWKSAKWLAASFGARVQGLLVRDSFFYPQLAPSPLDLDEAAARLREKLGAADDEIGTVVGEPGYTILNWGRNLDYDLVVMGTHARGGLSRFVSGSVAGEVVRRSEVPVLVVRRPLARVKTVLAPVNFEPYAEAGLVQAARVAQALGAKLTVLHVVDAPVYGGAGALKAARHMLSDVTHRLPADAREACKPKPALALGKPAEQIAQAARRADLVILAAHRRGVLGDTMIGTTAERVLRLCETPVLALPSGAPAAAETPEKGRAAKTRKAAGAPLF